MTNNKNRYDIICIANKNIEEINHIKILILYTREEERHE